MNILLWVLQILLALYYLMGGQWMVFKVPGAWLKILPKPVWMALGLLQALFALGLVLPPLVGLSPMVTPIAAVGVAVETLFVSALTKPKFQGLLWVIVPALLAAFVAYGRFVLKPF
jgi:hypothetical protein